MTKPTHLVLVHDKDRSLPMGATGSPAPPAAPHQGKPDLLSNIAFGSAVVLIALPLLIGLFGGWGWLSLVLGIMLAMTCLSYLVVETADWVRSIVERS